MKINNLVKELPKVTLSKPNRLVKLIDNKLFRDIN